MAIDSADPEGGVAFFSVYDQDKRAVAFIARELVRLGFSLLATTGTAAVLRASGVPCEVTGKIHEGASSVVDAIAAGEISLMINTPLGVATRDDGYELRRAAVRPGILRHHPGRRPSPHSRHASRPCRRARRRPLAGAVESHLLVSACARAGVEGALLAGRHCVSLPLLWRTWDSSRFRFLKGERSRRKRSHTVVALMLLAVRPVFSLRPRVKV